MLITKAIVSSDDNPLYLDFWEPISKLWKLKFGIEPVLLYFGKNSKSLCRKYGTIVDMPILEGIPFSTQCQCARIWYAGQCGSDVVITSDIDMLPLSPKYFVDPLKDIPDDKYVNLNPLNNDTYFPMCYNVGKSSTFKDVFQIEDDFGYFMKKLMDFTKGREDCLKNGAQSFWCLDEVYVSTMVNKYKAVDASRIVPIRRKEGVNGFRVDRPTWGYDICKVAEDYYYDSHCLRPYKQHKETIDRLVYSSLAVGVGKDGYGTHYPILSEILNKFPVKNVLEFGTGFFSTGIFVEKCEKVLSIEMQYTDWAEKVKQKYADSISSGVLEVQTIIEDSGLKTIQHLKNTFGCKRFDMVFVDGAGGSRPNCANYAKTITDIIICHDTEQPAYGWKNIIVDKDWQWIDVKVYNAWTSVFTRRKDVADFTRSLDYVDLLFSYCKKDKTS